MRFCDEIDHGFGWIGDEFLARTSHALVTDDGVWLIDPVAWDEAERRAADAGAVRGVIQLLDRHERDAPEIARRLGVPHHVLAPPPPFETIAVVRRRLWKEVALWWPEPRVLVVGDALGTIGYFVAGDEPLGVHPLLRLTPPRRLAALEPDHVLCGHGEGIHGDQATSALRYALRTSRRRAPRAWFAGFRNTLRGGS